MSKCTPNEASDSSPSTNDSKGESIIIVGAGAFGSSLALELVTNYKHKYNSVQVFDKWPVPSKDAASTDTSKIIRADYLEPIYVQMALEAIEIWKTDFYKGVYHQIGWVDLYDESDPELPEVMELLESYGVKGLIKLDSGKEVTEMFEMIDGPMTHQKGYFNPTSGWANSAEATYRVARAAATAGAIYHTGPDYEVRSLVYNDTGAKVIGIKSKSGDTMYAEKVIMCTGAWTNHLLDTEGQLRPRGHCLGYIQLTPEEYQRYSKMPVVDSIKSEIYFFPPFENGTMKFAAWTPDFHSERYRETYNFPRDDFPKEIEEQIRNGMREIVPALAEGELFDRRICWCIDTADSHFLISPHPKVEGLYLATGGSGHGFKFLPRMGHYIALMLEGTLPAKFAEKWKWRPELKWEMGGEEH